MAHARDRATCIFSIKGCARPLDDLIQGRPSLQATNLPVRGFNDCRAQEIADHLLTNENMLPLQDLGREADPTLFLHEETLSLLRSLAPIGGRLRDLAASSHSLPWRIPFAKPISFEAFLMAGNIGGTGVQVLEHIVSNMLVSSTCCY